MIKTSNLRESLEFEEIERVIEKKDRESKKFRNDLMS